MTATIETIRDDFEFLDEWEDRYRYVIELGDTLTPLPDSARTAENKVPGCVSQVWLTTDVGEVSTSICRASAPTACARWSPASSGMPRLP